MEIVKKEFHELIDLIKIEAVWQSWPNDYISDEEEKIELNKLERVVLEALIEEFKEAVSEYR